MADYAAVAKLFEDSIQAKYYETEATMKLKKELLTTLEHEMRQLLFLVGEPGCGKSLFLRQLPHMLEKEYRIILYDTPFFEPVDFIRSLITKSSQEVGSYALEEMIRQVVDLYKQSNTIVAIDEAQLLSKDMIELIRILADSKAFWFILAMHKHESQKILQEPQFSSRPYRLLEMEAMRFEEMEHYITKTLQEIPSLALENLFSRRVLKKIYAIAHGNFRDTKKIVQRMFLMMDYALQTNQKRYQKPSTCLVTMAAIDGGLLAV